MDIKKEIENLSASFDEVLSSAEAVKGEAFVYAVMTHFEAAQIVEIIGKLAELTPKEHHAFTKSIGEAAIHLMAELTCKACRGLSEADYEEAMKLGRTLLKRKNALGEVLSREARNGD